MAHRLLLTRPAADNMVLAEKLDAQGIATISSPLLRIERLGYSKPSLRPDGVLLTSRHAAYACADFADVPVYAVGAQTAEAAIAEGCHNIRAVAADAAQLLPLIPPMPHLLYFSGEDIRCDFADALPHSRIERIVTYKAYAAESLTPEAIEALRAGAVDGVALYSPRSAEIFHLLAGSENLPLFTAYCLSPAIARICRDAGGWRHIETAAEPNQAAMLQLFADAK